MNQERHDHPGHHQGHHHEHQHEARPGRQFHKDWRVWVALVVILAALGTYVLTNGEVLRPAPPPEQAAPASSPSK